MTNDPASSADSRVTSATRQIAAPAAAIFELIADPAQQPRWDGNDNLAEAPEDSTRVTAVGDSFAIQLTTGAVRVNQVVEFTEGRRIAWLPGEEGKTPPGHLWRWELEPLDEHRTSVTHTYDWSNLNDETRFERARQNTSEALMASIDRLAALAES